MKQIQINNFKEKLFYEELENGFKIFLVPLKNKKNFFTLVGVNYGGRDISFKIDDKTYTVPTGIAHFLEHKMFETEDNPFSFYIKSGTDVNASTSYDYTNYYITGNKNYKKNLTYLLEWIKNLNINEEQVEKEKGIILEEANMYKDNPDAVLLERINENIFTADPYKNKVIGSDEDIKKITKEDIELCYDNFYTSNNMILISSGNFNPDDAIKIIREQLNDYPKNNKKIEKLYGKETETIKTPDEILTMNVDVPRISSGYKINKNAFKSLNLSPYEIDLYLHILIDVSLGNTSEIRYKWLTNDLFVTSFYRIIEIDNYYVIEFIASSNKPDELKKELDKYLKDLVIEKESFERQKKLFIAREVKKINNIHSIGYSILDDVIDYGYFIEDKVSIIKKLNYKTLEKIKDSINFNIRSSVKIINKE